MTKTSFEFQKVVKLYPNAGHYENTFPDISSMDLATPIGGLRVYSALQCSFCSKIYRSEETMRNHHWNAHPTIPSPQIWNKCLAQQLNRGTNKTFFLVQDIGSLTNPNPSSEDIKTSLVTQAKHNLQEIYASMEVETKDARLISPWLLSTKWHQFVANLDTSALRALVALPKPSEFPGLSTTVKFYCARNLELIAQIDMITLQHLNTPDPMKTYVISLYFPKSDICLCVVLLEEFLISPLQSSSKILP